MKKLIVLTAFLLFAASSVYAYCSYYSKVDEYRPSYGNYKVCVYQGGPNQQLISFRYPSMAMCPYSIRYDDYNGYVCE